MPVGKRPRKNYYSIYKAKIRHKDNDGNENLYDYIEGVLTKIDLVKDRYQGKTTTKWHFYLEDQDHSQVDILTVGEVSSAARGLLLTMISKDGPIDIIRISPYTPKDNPEYTGAWIMFHDPAHPDADSDGFIDVEWDKRIVDNIPDHNRRKMENQYYFRAMAARIKNRKINTAGLQPGEDLDEDTGEIQKPYSIADTELHDDPEDDLPF